MTNELEDDIKHVYWAMMLTMEGDCEDCDVLKKVDVECMYRLWNRWQGADIKPRWMK